VAAELAASRRPSYLARCPEHLVGKSRAAIELTFFFDSSFTTVKDTGDYAQ